MSAPILSDAQELLAMLASEGGIHLVAIVPDGITQGRSFGSDTEAAIAWAIDQNKQQRGIYWTSNIVADGMNKKPSKADITAARVAHVDVDPPKDGTPWDKRAAFDEIMAQPLAPSFVIDSGNGLQAVWMMADPTDQKDAIECVNRRIEVELGGDACHNIDRLLRVPGFVNWPNKKKRNAGRVPVLAGWAMRDDGVRHTPEELQAAFPPMSAAELDAHRKQKDKPKQDSASSPWDSLSDDQQMKLHSIVMLPSGRDRSADLVAFVRQSIEAGVADDAITAFGTDARYPISAHALDQADPVRAVRRAIELVRRTPGHGETASGEIIEPVDLWGQFDPPELPQGLLPPLIEQWARCNADQMGCDPAGLAMSALAVCAAAIPDHMKLKVKRHDDYWLEAPRIWVALLGSPSTKKSPILSRASGPLASLDIDMMRAWQERVAKWMALEPEEKKGQPYPKQTRLRIEDTTIEAAQQVLEGSPWGVMLLQDELSGWFGAMDKYGGGKAAQADRAYWLRTFNGGEYAINRVTRGAGIIENNSVTLLGGIQPEPLRKIAGDATDDGLLQRLFVIVLRPATIERDEPQPPVNRDYKRLIENLRVMKRPGKLGFDDLKFSDEAQAYRDEFHAANNKLQSLEGVNRKLASHVGKYDGLFARLCVIWHCIENSETPHDLPEIIEADTARRVGEFLHGFLFAHAVTFYAGVMGLSDDHDSLTAIAGHILAHKLESVTNRDVQRGDRTMRKLRDYEIRPLLEQLDALGWLIRTEGPRPSSPPHFAVNPRVHEKFAARAQSEAQRRREVRETIGKVIRL